MKKHFSFENAKAAIFLADIDTGLITNCNAATAALLERERSEIIGHPQAGLHPPEKGQYYASILKKHIEQSGAFEEEVEVITTSGKTKQIRLTAVLTSAEGKPVVQGIFHDITERKKLEADLEASETRFRRLFESAQDGILILDARTAAVVEVNPFLVELLGYPREHFLGKKLWEIGPFKDIKTSKAAFKELQTEKYIRYEDLPLETEDGRKIDVEFVSNVYLVDHTKVIQCNIRDITERRKAAEEIRKIKISLEEAQALAHLGSWSFDPDTDEMVSSDEMRRIYDFDAASPVSYKDFVEHIHPEDKERYLNRFETLLEDGIPYTLDHRIVVETGSPRWAKFIANARINETGKIFLAYGAVLDITERKMMEKTLQENEERFKQMSFHDKLTGLYNRTYFAEEMARLGSDLSRSGPVSIISFDVDGMKVVNDTLGHQAGDDLLKAAAGIISTPFRKMDILARIGGDEFCAVLPGADYQVASARKNEIAKLIEAYNEKNPTVSISISLGIATSKGTEEETIYNIYQRADENMYENKMLQTKSPRSSVLDVLMAALFERDYIAQGHVKRLTKLAEMAADKMNLPVSTRRNLMLLAKVHDLGKLGIADKILFKPEKLSEPEYQIIKEHSRIGHNLASHAKELFHMADLILHHHESWDGSGYTDGLRGKQIPLECRIFSILDAYDAMTNTRPYHEGISKEEALEELRRQSGIQFEPALVDQFIKFL